MTFDVGRKFFLVLYKLRSMVYSIYMTTSTPSEKQVAFLTKLAAERVGNPVAAEAMAKLEAGTLERKACSNFIDQLLAAPKTTKVVPAASEASFPAGFYFAGSRIFKVQIAHHGSGNAYCKELNQATGTFEYSPGTIKKLASLGAEVLTFDKAKELGALYGRCMICGATLTNEVSIEEGIGPVCGKRLPGYVTPAATKKAAKIAASFSAPAPAPAWKVAVETAGQTSGTSVFTPADERMMQAMEAWSDVLESYEFFDGEVEIRAEATRKFFKSFGLTAPVGV